MLQFPVGWQVANVPLTLGKDLDPEVFEVMSPPYEC